MRLAALVLAVPLLLVGCGGGDQAASPTPAAPSAAATSAPRSAIPSPAAADITNLKLDILAVAPSTNPDKIVDLARNTCTSILGGSDPTQLETATVTRFSDSVGKVTTAQAPKIIAAVKAQPWCKPVS